MTRTNSPVLRMSASMTDLDVLDRLKGILGGRINTASRRKGKEHWKEAWVWSIDGAGAYLVMSQLLPFMGIRRSEKIKVLLAGRDAYERSKTTRISHYESAAQHYLSTSDSLRETAKLFNIHMETVRRHVSRLNMSSRAG